MRRILLALLFSCVASFGAAFPAVVRSPWTTNQTPTLATVSDVIMLGSNVVVGIIYGNGGGLTNLPAILYLGDQGATSMLNATNPFGVNVLGLTRSGASAMLWFANGTGTGSNSWGLPAHVFGGFYQLGDEWQMPFLSTNLQNTRIFFNGSPHMTTRAFVDNGVVVRDSCLYIQNVNPFSSGSFIALPMYGTNATGRLVGTNDDGVKIYLRNQFGMQMGAIPDAYNVGETNTAPCYILLSQDDFNTYYSVNTLFTGEVGSSQKAYMVFEPITGLLHFPQWALNVWAITNANYKEAFAINVRSAEVFARSNFYARDIFVTNRIDIIAPIADGPTNLIVRKNDGSLSVTLGTGASAAYSGIWLSPGVSTGNNYTMMSQGADNFVNAPDANGTIYFRIGNASFPLSLTKSSLTSTVPYQQATNEVSTWPTSAATGGGFALVNSNATVYILTSTPDSTTWAATNKLAGP